MNKNNPEEPPQQGLDSWVTLKAARVPPKLEAQARMYRQKDQALQDAQSAFDTLLVDFKVFGKVKQELQDFLYKNGVYAAVSIGFSKPEQSEASIMVLLYKIEGGSYKAAQLGQNFLDIKPAKINSSSVRWDVSLR